MKTALPHLDALSAEEELQLRRRLDRFEDAWKRGERPVLEDHLPAGGAQRWATLVELVHTDLEYRFKTGEPVRVEHYLQQYPELESDAATVLELILTEVDWRRRAPTPALAEYLARFPRYRAVLEPHFTGASQNPGLLPPKQIPNGFHAVPRAARPIAPEAVNRADGDTPRQDLDSGPSLQRSRLGKWKLLEVVGSGSFGTVYKALDTELHRMVAVKVPHQGSLASREDVDRFLREARSAAQLQHAGIVAVHEAGQCDGTYYLVSEFIPGMTLRQRLAGERLSFPQAAELLARVAEALHCAHEHGVIHRDIKPSNILLDREGQPHLADFGLAKRQVGESTLTTVGQVLGTPAYMSPEQACGESHRVDGRSDLYSLGVVFYELLTGELPFRGTSQMLLAQVLEEEPRPPRRLNDGIPRDLETICLKCLRKEPQRRYASAQALADDLRRFRAGEPIQARPLGAWARAAKWARRRPAAAGLIVVSAAALLGLLLGGWAYVDRERQQAREAEQRERAGRRDVYAAHLNLAQQTWERGSVPRMLELLDGQRPRTGQEDLRSFEWYYLWRLCHGDRFTLAGHTDLITAVAFSPDGQMLATGSYDQTVKLWDVAAGRERIRLEGHGGEVRAVAFSPDGTTLATANADRTARLWDVRTGQERGRLDGHSDVVCSLAFSPDGKTLATGSWDQTVILWEMCTGRQQLALRGHTAEVRSIAFAPDGKTLATSSRPQVGPSPAEAKVWDVATGKELATLREHTDLVAAVAISPDGETLATGSRDFTVKLWDVATRQVRARLEGHLGPVNAVTFSPDGETLATASSDKTIRLWSVSAAEPGPILQGHIDQVFAVAFSPDSKTLASGGKDATIKLWDLTRKQGQTTLAGHTKAVLSLAFDPSSRTLATASRDRTVKLWDMTTGKVSATFESTSTVQGVAFSPDGQALAVARGGKMVKLWDPATGRERATLRGQTERIACLAFAPDGRTLAAGGWDRSITLWDVASKEVLRRLEGHSAEVRSVAFSPDGRTLASASGESQPPSLNGEVILWDAATGQERATFRGHTKGIASVAFSPDGKTLASASWDQTVKLWDAATGQERATLTGHNLQVTSLAFSRDGKTLATGSQDHAVKLWDAVTCQERLTLQGFHSPIYSLAFAPDGQALAVGTRNGTVQLFQAASGPTW
jgi:WD40 repeat protein